MRDPEISCPVNMQTRDDFLLEIGEKRAALAAAIEEDDRAEVESQLADRWQQMWTLFVLTDEDWRGWISDSTDRGEVVAKWYLDTRSYEAAIEVIEEAAHSERCLQLIEPVVLEDFKSHYAYGLDIWKRATTLLKRAASPSPIEWNAGIFQEKCQFLKSDPPPSDKAFYKHDAALERWQVESFERKDDPQTVIRAINFYASLPQRSIVQVFTSFVYGKTSSEWVCVWLRFVPLLNKELKKLNRECDTGLRLLFMKHFPHQPEAYEFALYETPFDYTMLRIVSEFLINRDLIAEPVLKNQVLRILPHAPSNQLLRQLFKSALKADDPLHTVERATIELLQKRGQLDEAQELMDEMLADSKAALQVEVWLLALQVAQKTGRYVIDIFVKAFAMVAELDWPERLMDEWRRHVYVYGFDADITEFQKYEKKYKTILQQTVEEETKKRTIEENAVEGPPQKKQKATENPIGGVLAVIVSNIPESSTEKTIARFFKGYGTPKRTRVFKQAREAIVEFSGDVEMSSVLSRSGKKIDENEVAVLLLAETSLWISIMFMHSDKAIETLEKFGNVVDIEYPFFSEHRTGYVRVEYSSTQSALKAAFNIGAQRGVHLCNPLLRDPQLETFVQKRVVLWTNPPSDIESDDIYALFGDAIQRIYCKNIRGEGDEKFIYMTFASPEEAKTSLDFNGKTLTDDQPGMELRLAEKAPYEIPEPAAPADFYLPRRLDILNIPKDFTENSLTWIFEVFGQIERLKFYPDNKKAVITFKRAIDAAACETLLSGIKIGKDKLKVFLNTAPKPRPAPKPKAPTMFIPRGALLNAKTKPHPTEKKPTGSSEPTEKNGKSNEDFRKLLFRK